MDSRAALSKGRRVFGQPPLMRIGGLFLTRTASFALALQWAARFPLRFSIPVD